MLWKEQSEFAYDVSRLIQHINIEGFYCTLGEAYRPKETAELYAKRGIGIKNSLHCRRLAIDINLFSKNGEYLTDSDDYKQFGDYWKSLDPKNRWGGDFPTKDGNHFERKP